MNRGRTESRIPTMVARRRWLFPTVGLVLVSGLGAERLATLAATPATDFDDAYMYLRYAVHVLNRHGLVWNIGEAPVYGVTSLLHLAWVTAIRWLAAGAAGAHVLRIASGSAAIAFVAALVGLAAIASRHPRLHRNWVFWTAVLVPLIAYQEAFVFHAGTGMDTMWSALANTVLALATLRLLESPKRSRIVQAALVGFIAVLARPDNLPCAILCPALALTLPRPRWKELALFLALSLGSLLGFALLAWRLLGSPVPLSFFVKQPGFYPGFAGEFGWNPFLFLRIFLRSAWPFLVLLMLCAGRVDWRRAAVLLLPALLAILALFRMNQIMGHLGRFDYPFLPFFVAAGVVTFDRWLLRIRTGTVVNFQRSCLRVAASLAVVLLTNLALSAGARGYDARAKDEPLAQLGGYHVVAQTDLPEMDSWRSARAIAAIAASSPTGTRFAMSEHGLPGALAPNANIIDVLGLHDLGFARHGFSAAELFRREPDFIWLPHEDHTRMLRDILDSDEFWTRYVFFPEAFYFGVALRTDSPRYAELRALLDGQWRLSYPGVAMDARRAERDRSVIFQP